MSSDFAAASGTFSQASLVRIDERGAGGGAGLSGVFAAGGTGFFMGGAAPAEVPESARDPNRPRMAKVSIARRATPEVGTRCDILKKPPIGPPGQARRFADRDCRIVSFLVA